MTSKKSDPIARSISMQNILHLAKQIAQTNATILLLGETGVGKEVIARYIYMHSLRANNVFVPVNTPGLTESLIESELFGHEKGAFTGAVSKKKGFFELTTSGTIFLDEIGDITPSVQAKLLRVIELKEFQRVGGALPVHTNARIIAATNQDLKFLVQKKTVPGGSMLPIGDEFHLHSTSARS